MATGLDNKILAEAFSIIADTLNTEVTIGKLRDLLRVDHIVYYLPKLGGAPYVRLTYPASWIKRYLEMNYSGIDPIAREGIQRTVPFSWSEMKITGPPEASFMEDALAHGIGPHGFSIPLSGHGHWALFSISSSRSEQDWVDYLSTTQSTVVQIANQLHRRVVAEIFGIDPTL
jgi:hypothetical protein